jgi:hypothetical protein
MVFAERLLWHNSWCRHGFYLSFGAHFNPASVAITPIEQMFCETDNHTNIKIEAIFAAVANAKDILMDDLKNIACRNALVG